MELTGNHMIEFPPDFQEILVFIVKICWGGEKKKKEFFSSASMPWLIYSSENSFRDGLHVQKHKKFSAD